ncbi:hypothetical protein RRSWK_04964 [Rhodopirellula sp. SWK7]|nr:hypothetical protein RRSWK_04964 [Rhodopirellula sp. SWK7]
MRDWRRTRNQGIAIESRVCREPDRQKALNRFLGSSTCWVGILGAIMT